MLYAVPPELARALTPSKADRSLCKHRVKDGLPSCPAGEAAGQGPGRSAAASLAQAPSSSLLTASSDRDGKEMGPLLLSLNKCSRTCNLLVSAWARGPHRNSWRAGSLSATCRYSRRPLSPQDDDTQKYHQEAVLGHAPLITLHPITGTRHRQSRKRRRRRRRRRRRTRRTGGMRPPPAQPPAAAHPPGPGRLLGPEGLPQPGGAHSSEPGT
nr:uncharacterized protein LOC105106552 isoform X4 [Camelus dromedarius]